MYRIEISNNRKLEEIQDEFNEFFPHLNIQFYQLSELKQNQFTNELVKNSNAILQSFKCKENSGVLFLNDDLTVAELKKNLLNFFGLKAEIFQKTGAKIWSLNPISDHQFLHEIDFEIS